MTTLEDALAETAPGAIWNGAEALKPYLVDINTLDESKENARKGDVMELAASLKRFGQVRAISVDGNGTIVAGHHLRKAAIELGWTHIAAVPNEFASDEERIAYLFADNQLSSLGGYDEQKLGEQLDLLDAMASNGTLEGTGYTMDTLEDARANFGKIAETEMPADLERGYAEDAAEAAERAANLGSSKAMKEIVLMVTPEQHEEFGRYVRVLQKAYATDEAPSPGVVACVVRAVGERAISIDPEASAPPVEAAEDAQD